jgi:hypothetical protein
MLDRIMSGVGRTTAFSGLVLGSLLVAQSTAPAGTCPADQMKTDVRAPVTHAAKGVTDTVLGAIDLAKEPAAIKDRQLRFRKHTIEPGAIIFIQEGEIIEYASNCAVPIVHKTGDIRPETNPTSHWWENKGSKTVVLYVGDVLHDKTDKNM